MVVAKKLNDDEINKIKNDLSKDTAKKVILDYKYDSNLIDAKVVDGLLTLFVPFKAEVKPKKIKVN